MKIELARGSHLLRITLLAPANLGSTGGSAALDRPVSLDAYQSLPYLPGSSLRGVLAGRKGNLRDDKGDFNATRTTLYGSPDDTRNGNHVPGLPSRVLVGDGELLCFPCALEERARLVVFPVLQLARIVKLGGWTDQLTVPKLDDDEYAAPISLPTLGMDLKRRSLDVDQQAITELAALHDSWHILLAGRKAARSLWRRSSESRTLTAVDKDTKVVKDGSLRRIELIPPGTVFLSFMSVRSGDPVAIVEDQPLQLGAWENIGLGYAWLDVVAPPTRHPVTRMPPGKGDGGESDAEVMRRVFDQVQAIVAKEEAPVAYSLCRELGPRWGAGGIGRTLAFCVAKARLMAETAGSLSREAKAYRWFLEVLFDESDQQSLVSHIQAVIEGREGVSPAFRRTLVWLSRYAEILLKPSKVIP